MNRPADSALQLLQRAEHALRRRTSRASVPVEEATLTTMLESPLATVELTADQTQTLADLRHDGVPA